MLIYLTTTTTSTTTPHYKLLSSLPLFFRPSHFTVYLKQCIVSLFPQLLTLHLLNIYHQDPHTAPEYTAYVRQRSTSPLVSSFTTSERRATLLPPPPPSATNTTITKRHDSLSQTSLPHSLSLFLSATTYRRRCVTDTTTPAAIITTTVAPF
ncbi:hypothetical protein E2C01_079962 [Portunus trituberculatus]|uniref:Uncharacterized protein n=1 Tax=Portunus trituberculatus TaxID=210409 RepID=A0A5B7ISQ4_PORTR|nr:hypothetical protein [Portunus trituberculatus]